jgi:YesN/AraC family two-component response regulator
MISSQRENHVQNVQILWVDLRYNKDASCVGSSLASVYKIRVISHASEVEEAIQRHQPQMLCFDYDYPDQVGLKLLQQSKTRYPALPLVMLTKDQSAELVIWALRSRVWNYYIKPVPIDNLVGSIEVALKKCLGNKNYLRKNFMPQPVVPAGSRPYRIKKNGASTAYVESWVQQHLDEKITLEQVAGLCGMSKSYFSRTFRCDHRITFQDYLIRQRINKAVDLLKDSDLQVTQVALAVGFSDLSYFTRTFHRHVGLLPSDYRKSPALRYSMKPM